MKDRFKFKIAAFRRESCNDIWEFDHFIEDCNKWHLTTCGDIASVGCYYAYHSRDNAPDSVHMVYEALMCTGLKDKNGKLIYEEDIIKDNSTNSIYKVAYKKCAMYLENEEYIGYLHELRNCFTSDRLEIIGNIYENPEILND